MKEKLFLTIPEIKDLYFKKELKEDPNTMDYNKGYDVSYNGYNYNNGTIKTDINELKDLWYPKWINNWPQTYYAYITKENGSFIGETYAKWDEARNAYEIGIIIKGEYRGRGYSSTVIGLLCDKLKELGAKKLYHELPTERIGAIKAEINNGFVIVKENIDGMKKFGEIEKLVYLEKTL